jgi:hypothetical protein
LLIKLFVDWGWPLQTDEIDRIHGTLVEDFGSVNYKAFTSLLVEITQDTSSAGQLSDAFAEMANDKVSDPHLFPLVRVTGADVSILSVYSFDQPYITELDLQMAMLPASSIDFLKSVNPFPLAISLDAFRRPHSTLLTVAYCSFWSIRSVMPSQELDTEGHENVDEREKVAFDYDGFLSDCFEDPAVES